MESISKSLKPVIAAKPVAPYIGGKRVLAKRLCARINRIDHKVYAEPFIGMGGVFFRRKYGPHTEVINDYSKDVMTLFRILQRHYPQFIETLKFQVSSRAEFERLVRVDADTLTDLERAARFLYLQRNVFGGLVGGKSFGVSPDGRSSRFNLAKVVPMLEDVHERLSGVVIECLHYSDFIDRYDKKSTLFYLDPPYFNCEDDYGQGMFDRTDFVRLADQLGRIKGRFILSLNDVPEIREIFDGFDIESVETTYSLSRQGNKRVGEVIISNGV